MGEADEIVSALPAVGLTFSASGSNPFGLDCAPDCFGVPGLTLFHACSSAQVDMSLYRETALDSLPCAEPLVKGSGLQRFRHCLWS